MEISTELANVIKEQCIGETAGHMANIPNNPILYSIFYAISGKTKLTINDFAEILIKTGERLKEQK